MHEVKDQFGALAAVVDRATRPTSSQEVADAVHSAFRTWAYNRPRPVFIEVPVDVLEGTGEVDLQPAVSELPVAAHDDAQLAKLATLIQEARAPVMVVGGGAVNSYQMVRHVAELAGIPVIETIRGKGVMPTDHPLGVGPVLATEAARALVGGADLAVFVGTELSDAELDGRPLVCTGTVCRIDISENQLHKNLSADIALHCDAGLALTQLAGELTPVATRDGEERAIAARRTAASELATITQPHRWIHEALQEVLSREDIVVGDSSQVTYQGSLYLWPSTVPDGLVAPASFATLGYALPAAIGCNIARTGRRVVALLGDGALMFSVQELRTAADLGQPLPVLVVDNGGYREIAEEMDGRGIPRTAVDLAAPNFEALAKAMGCAYADGSNPEALVQSLRSALQHMGPTLIRIPDRAVA
jgi:acetolactate synthase-1/2/3 large subunit